MPTQRLENLLSQVQVELEQLGESSPEERQRLESLIAEIETTLDRDGAEHHASCLDSVRANLVDMEGDHPTASGVARRLMQALSDMGI